MLNTKSPSLTEGIQSATKLAEVTVAAFLVENLLRHQASVAAPWRNGLAWFLAAFIGYWIPPTSYKRLGLFRWLIISTATGVLAIVLGTVIG